MSIEKVREVLGRAITDEDFREMLFSNPDKALGSFDLTNEEINQLKMMEREEFDKNATELEDRMSRAGIGFTSLDPDDIGKWDPGEWDPGERLSSKGVLGKLFGN